MDVFKHAINFLYILTFFSGISCITILSIIRERGDRIFPGRYSIFFKLILSLLLFLAVNFLMFYQEYFSFTRHAEIIKNILLLFCFDLLLVVTLYHWIKLNGLEAVNRWLPLFKTIGCAYIIFWLAVYIADATFPEGRLAILRASMAICADAVFCLLTLEGLFYCVHVHWKNREKDRNYHVVLNAAFSFYLLYMYVIDLLTALDDISARKLGAKDFYFLDPVIFLFLIVNIYSIIYILWQIRAHDSAESERADGILPAVTSFPLETIESVYNLTQRESETLELLLRGMNNPRIAESLCISIYTVKRHMNNIFRKLKVKNRYELILLVENHINQNGEC